MRAPSARIHHPATLNLGQTPYKRARQAGHGQRLANIMVLRLPDPLGEWQSLRRGTGVSGTLIR